MNYKKSYQSAKGYTPICKSSESSLKNLQFGMIELEKEEELKFDTGECETAFIVLEGQCNVGFVSAGGERERYENVGNRRSVFENRRAECFYMPRRQKLTITAVKKVKIAVCGSLVSEDTSPQLLREERVVLKVLGEQPYQRETSFLIDGHTNAIALTVGEGYPTAGNWAGFPPHKHDEDRMPEECIAEEVYYFLFEPEQGFAVQCLYTADGRIDEAYRVKGDELVEFPEGYHTTVSIPGYQTYFLWAMAGKHQGFYRSNDPAHEWVLKET